MLNLTSYASSSAGNCHVLDDGVTKLLLDAGVPARRLRKEGLKLSGIAGCLLSHIHKDHSKAIPDLMRAAVDCYMLKETAAGLGFETNHRAIIAPPLKAFNVGSFKIMPFLVKHDVPCAGFMMSSANNENAIYLTDAAYSPFRFNLPLHLIAIECNYDNVSLKNSQAPTQVKHRVMQSHFGLGNVIELLKANDISELKEVHLLHLSNDNANATKIKQQVASVCGVPVFIANE